MNALAFCVCGFDKTDQTLNACAYERWLWNMIMKYDYEIWLRSKEWNMIMKYDYETWLWIMIIKHRMKRRLVGESNVAILFILFEVECLLKCEVNSCKNENLTWEKRWFVSKVHAWGYVYCLFESKVVKMCAQSTKISMFFLVFTKHLGYSMIKNLISLDHVCQNL